MTENDDGTYDWTLDRRSKIEANARFAEEALIRSRWLAPGEGRADMRVMGGNLADLVVEASECRDSSFGRIFYADNQGWMPAEGDEADCAFAASDLP